MKYAPVFIILLCLGWRASAATLRIPSGLSIGAGLSATSGLNGFVGIVPRGDAGFWSRRFGLRFDFADTVPIRHGLDSVLDSVMSDGVDIGDGVSIDNGKLKARHIATLLDFYPFAGAFRISGGYFWGRAHLDADIHGAIDGLSPNDFHFELAGYHYYYTGNTVHGTAGLDWHYRGPYIGGGWDWGLVAGLKIYMDVGVVFTNRSAHTHLDVPVRNLWYYNAVVNTWVPVNTPALQAQLDAARDTAIRDADDELGRFRLYPVLKLGLMYRF